MRRRAEAAPTTTGRASTARWPGSGKRDGKAYVRNQRLNAPQESHQLQPGGSGLDCSAHPSGMVSDVAGRGTSGPGDVAGGEATVKACGVAVAMLQGHSWAPTPSNGSGVNVGPIPPVPFPGSRLLPGGKAHRRPMPVGWGGGPVVVRGRESRSHGKGSSVFAARSHHREDVGEHRRAVAGAVSGSAPGTGDADQAAPLGGGRSRPPLR